MNTTQDILEFTKKMNDELQSKKGTLEKQEVLGHYYKENKDITTLVLSYVYDKNLVFNVKPPTVEKFKENKKYNETNYVEYEHINELFDALISRDISGNIALKSVAEFIKKYKKYEDLIYMILKKNLEIRLNIKSINKVFDLLPDFGVSLGKAYEPEIVSEKYKDSTWFISRKLDGVRCIAYVNIKKEIINYFSRMGVENKQLGFLTVDFDFELMKKMGINKNFYFDGEIVSMSKNKENFKNIMELIKCPEKNQETLHYYIFDMLTEEEFTSKTGSMIFSKRMEKLYELFEDSKMKRFLIVDQFEYTEKIFDKMMKKSKKEDWEGLILRRDTNYKGKRSDDLLKVKLFQDAEYTVIGVLNSEIRYIDKETGLQKKEMMVKSLILDFNDTKVGSGLSMKERQYFYLHPEEIIGKMVTIQYFEETENKGEKTKLRFPTLKYIHGREREY